MTAPDPALARAWALLDAGRTEQALDELARVPAALADDPHVLSARAEALLRLERWIEAAAAARHGLAAAGPDAALFAQLGQALYALGDHQGAEHAYLNGLREEPHDVLLLCRYALLCLAANQVPKAAGLLALAAEEDPNHPMVYIVRIQTAFVNGGNRAAERVSREYLAAYPESASARAMHGFTTSHLGRTTAAYESFRQAVAAEPTDPDYAEAARQARINAHPLLIPLRPMYRLGVVRTWLIAAGVIVGSRLLGLESAYRIAAVVWLAYAAYSWVVPPLVSRMVPGAGVGARRGYTPFQWVLGVVVLLIALSCAGLAVPDVGPDLRAARGNGVSGTMVLREKACGDCPWHGDFTSADGELVRRNVTMREGMPADARPGDRVPAIDTGADDSVFPPTGSTQWRSTSAFAVGSGIVVVAWIIIFPVMTLLNRRS
jgi:tetratricopeptide (TPR) repeat protein